MFNHFCVFSANESRDMIRTPTKNGAFKKYFLNPYYESNTVLDKLFVHSFHFQMKLDCDLNIKIRVSSCVCVSDCKVYTIHLKNK